MAYHADNALPSHSEGERVLPMQKGGKQRLKKSDIWVTGSFDVPFLALSLLLLTIGLVMLFPPPMPMLFIMMMATAMLISAAS